MGARPAPGTTELLEVLDRALGGGIVIDMSRAPKADRTPSAKAGRIVVTAFETYLQHADPMPSRHSEEPL